MDNSERWRPSSGGSLNPSARLKAARSMPPWMQPRGAAYPPPPPPPVEEPPIDPDYEVIDFPGQTYSNAPIQEIKHRIDGKKCDLCGSSAPSVRCTQCSQNFCPSCDEMYHRHPKRQTHLRKELEGKHTIVRPPLPPKGEAAPPPVPPPRRNKRTSRTPVPPMNPLDQNPTSKVGFVGSLKRMVSGRPLPAAPFHPGPMHPDMPPHMGYQGNMISDWDLKSRSGSFSNIHSPFNPMMQAHSMAQLNCAGCQHGMWDPWQANMPSSPMVPPWGIPPNGAWHSSAFLNRRSSRDDFRRNSLRRPVRDSSSGSEEDRMQNRRRNPSPALSRRSRNQRSDYESDEDERGNWGRFTQPSRIPRRASMADGMNRNFRQDDDTMSVHSGRRGHTLSRKESLGNASDRGFKYDRQLERRNSRRNDFESQKYEPEPTPRTRRKTFDYPEDGRLSRNSNRGMSDFEDENRLKADERVTARSRRNERFTDTGRRRNSPMSYKASNESVNNAISEEVNQNGNAEEEEEEELGPVPDTQWECSHCTFINEPGTRVCSICCKTTSKPKTATVKKETKPEIKPQIKKEKPKDYEEIKITQGIKKMEIQSPFSKGTTSIQKKGIMTDSRKNLTSTGTSPPPQSISTQTYEVTGHKVKRANSVADYAEWRAPQRSFSRQSLFSDTQSLPVTPPKGRSPERFSQEATEQPPRKNSDQFSTLRVNGKRAGSQPPEYLSTLVQKQVKQGMEMVKLLREAEEQQFTADDLAVALIHCEDGDPVAWLQQNWRNMIDTVVTLGTNYGHERKENTVGTISASEARDALRMHDGNVWAAVTECVEQRQKKYAELLSRGNFSREDIVTVLTANHGNLEAAYLELSKSQLKPFLMRIWGPPQGADNDSGDFTKLAHGTDWEGGSGYRKDEEVSLFSNDSNERIQNWLENYVHKPKLSQSLMQLNSISSKNSDYSDIQISPKYQNTKFNRNRRSSDVHRYLTHCFTASNSLQIELKHSSMQDLTAPVTKADPLKEFLSKNLNQGFLMPQSPKTERTVSSNQSTSEHPEETVSAAKSEDKISQSSHESEEDEDEQPMKRSFSSSESYESIDESHSSEQSEEEEEEEEEENDQTLKTNTILVDDEEENQPEVISIKIPIKIDDVHSEKPKPVAILTEITQIVNEILNNGESGTSSDKPCDVTNVNEETALQPEDSPVQQSNLPENVQVPNKLSVPLVVENPKEGPLKEVQVKILTPEVNEEAFENTAEQQITAEVQTPQVNEEAFKNTAEQQITARVETLQVNEEAFENSSEQHITAIKGTESPLVFTENSDLDVSPIPTDSEKEQNSEKVQPPKNSSDEIVNLLKESLSKDDVVEKIVSTLFQSVLRASVDFQNFPLNEHIKLLRSNSKVSVDSRTELEENLEFYEAEENQERNLSGTSGIGSDDLNVLMEKEPMEAENEITVQQIENRNEQIEPLTEVRPEISGNVKDETKDEIKQEELGNAEREARRLLAEGLVDTYVQAELAIKLMDLNFDEEQCVVAAKECDNIETAITYLQQECYLCAGKYSIKQMTSMLECEHICCQDCAKNYFTLQITERTINDCVCPFCKEPEIGKIEEDKALNYFSNLDILLKTLVKENVHELFQRKLRDRTLMQDPNFIWCGQCSSGFIANPRQKRLICPDCKNISCASCRKTWQKEHEKMTCQEFKEWLEYNDPENQLERHLKENGVTCPKCKTRYILAKGGCMHLTCPHCKHEFCQGCGKPFLMGSICKVMENCEKLGLHSHHPRNCLFYLRDKEPAELQRLLEENGIEYRPTTENLTNRCKVQLLKETDDGFVEAICGYPVEGGGFCRKHYVEYLSLMIRDKGLDPIQILDSGDLETIVKRAGRKPPPNPYGTPDAVYRDLLLEVRFTRTHYIEHLVSVIRDFKVDPVVVMDATDVQQELRRHGKPPPTREDYKSDHEYLAVCMKVIREHIPLD